MTYQKFIEHLAGMHPEMFKQDAKKIIQVVFTAIENALLSGDSVTIPGVCTIFPKFLEYPGGGKRWTSPYDGKERTIKNKVQLRCRPMRSFERRMTERLIDEQQT